MKLVGANPSPQLTGWDDLPGKSNYLFGNNPAKWRTNVPNYAKVKYADVYPGIDLAYYGNQRQLEYDFVIAPGADPRAIRFAIDGDEKRRIDGQGDLVLKAAGREVRLHRPVIYQEINGARQRIGGNFVIHGTRQVGFEVARYDSSKPLIIDPVLSYSTYLDAPGYNYGSGIAVDSSGNAYITGITNSGHFPTVNAFQAPPDNPFGDVFVTKFNAAGSALVYSTYLVKETISDVSDFPPAIAVDSSGNAYVTGSTGIVGAPSPVSPGFSTVNAFQATNAGGGDAFVTKLSATGSALVYSTYLGGSDLDYATGIAVDSAGNAYVTGSGGSANFSTANAFQATAASGVDAFVMKLNVAGSAPVYSTYLGGNGDDYGWGIAVDGSGNAYVTGFTYSTNFPTANAFQAKFGGGGVDAFVTKLNFDGSALVYSTYLGGNGGDGFNDCDCPIGLGIAVDTSGSAYVTGWTTSTDFPTANAFQAAPGGIFLTKFPAVPVGPDPWQQAITAMKTAAGTDSANFWQWAWYWQRSPAFSGAPAGFGVLGSIDNIPGLIDKIVAAGGGDGFQMVSAEQWVLDYRQAVQPPDPWQQAITAMKTTVGTDSLNFWQWAWFWQRSATFAGEPTGFGVLGSIDNTPGLIDKIVAVGGGDGFQIVSAEQWVLYYRQAAA